MESNDTGADKRPRKIKTPRMGQEEIMNEILFWRTVTEADDFSASFDEAEVEFVEFSSEDEFDNSDIFEISSACICYNPFCSHRRYKDGSGRIYARCLASEVAGDVADQLKQGYDEDIAEALEDLGKYISETGFVTRNGENILFADAPAWWREQCIAYIADCFEDDADDDD